MTKKKHLLPVFCLLFLTILFLLALFPTLLTPHSFETQYPDHLLSPPSTHFLLGTDELGRDLLSRILFGARVSLSCALLATLIAAVFGVLYGSVSGYVGGKLDDLLMRILDILYSIPDLLFYILLGLYLGYGFWGILIALAGLSWVGVARITRGEILKYKEMPFIESERALGAGPIRILFCHLIPQLRGPLIVTLLFRIPSVILAESTLSFIGLGLKPPFASWGTLASEGYSALRFYPHLIVSPSLFIFLTIFSFYTLGQRLKEKT